MKQNFALWLFLAGTTLTQVKLNTEDNYCENFVKFETDKRDNANSDGIEDVELIWDRDIRDSKKRDERYFYLEKSSLVYRTVNCYEIVKGSNAKDTFENTFEISFKEEDSFNMITLVAPAILDNSTSLANSVDSILTAVNTPGTTGQFAYEEGDNVVVVLQNPVKINNNEITQLPCPNNPSDFYWFNCLANDEAKLTEYFRNQITYNYALWLFIFLMMGYFMIAIFLSYTMDSYYDKEEVWSLHPVYSINNIATGIYTKRARLTILFLEILSITMVSACMTKYLDQSLVIRLIVYPLAGIGMGIIVAYIAGFLLNRYYNSYRDYFAEIKVAESLEQRNYALEGFEKQSYQTEFVFYLFCSLIAIAFNALSIIFMLRETSTDFGWWILGIAIGVAINLLILDVLIVLIAKAVPGLIKLFRIRGFYYDHPLNQDYKHFFKFKY